MSTHRVQTILIGDGSAIPAAGAITTMAAGDIAMVGLNGAITDASPTVAEAGDKVFIFQKNTDGSLKRTAAIPFKNATKFNKQSFLDATPCVKAIGYQRGFYTHATTTTTAAAGAIVVANSTLYEFTINFKNDKQNYSERTNSFRLSFTSAAAATQATIATQIAALINGNKAIASQVSAVVVGDGTGALGLTGGTGARGIEITGKSQAQFPTSYKENIVEFDVFLDATSGFSTTPVVKISEATPGTGGLIQVSNIERFNFGYDGVLNRTLFPFPNLASAVATSLTSTAITPDANATGITAGEDTLTLDVSGAGVITPGSTIIVDPAGTPETFIVKYLISTTKVVTMSVATLTNQSKEINKGLGYDLINIEFSNPTFNDGPGMINDNLQSVIIACPSDSTQASDIITRIESYFGVTIPA